MLRSKNANEMIKYLGKSEKISIYDDYELFWREIKKIPILTKEETNTLVLEAQQGSIDARNKLVMCNLKLVGLAVKKFRNRLKHFSLMDITQEGVLGLIDSINGYVPEKGAFSTWAVIAINGAINRALENKNNGVRIPVYWGNMIAKYYKILDECILLGTPVPNDEEMCQKLNITMDNFILNDLEIGIKDIVIIKIK